MKILLIEDEKEICKIYEETLSSGGYNIISIYDGDSGYEVAKKGDWDLLLLDIMLPNKDGIEILSQLNSDGLVKERKVIILSNIENNEVFKKSQSLGAHKYIIKSEIKPSELLEIVSSI
jgi:DNA-binding response OmpR family regulator